MVTAVVGANWGDEGKGKMTDLLSENADIVVRFQGGANAGHTIINDYGKIVLHILPSGVCRSNTVNVIAHGVALNLDNLFSELDYLKSCNVPEPKLKISERAQIVMPYHVLFDKLEETRLGKNSFGSTKSGIAPFYSDKYLKIGIQVADVFSDGLKAKLERVCEMKNIMLKSLYKSDIVLSADELYDYLMSYKSRLEPFVCDTAYYIYNAVKQGKNVLLEGQLGSLRDPDNGIYPFVTSSSPICGYATVSAVIPPYEIKKVVTVVKAYSSCVGAGAFVSEIFGDEAEELRKRGGDKGEYGATTGRPRRMGWFDCVATRYGCMLQGTTDVSLTILDALSYLEKIPVVTGYEIDGKITDEFPCTPKLDRAKPVIEYLDGFCGENIRGVREYDKLPENAKKYIEFIENKIGFRISYISTGPDRNDIIYR